MGLRPGVELVMLEPSFGLEDELLEGVVPRESVRERIRRSSAVQGLFEGVVGETSLEGLMRSIHSLSSLGPLRGSRGEQTDACESRSRWPALRGRACLVMLSEGVAARNALI
eukprot:6172095-Prymnesium_polylepis.1